MIQLLAKKNRSSILSAENRREILLKIKSTLLIAFSGLRGER
jgi:hypothetical protein